MPSLIDLIDALPSSPDGIANHLRAEGVKGLPGSSAHCPIAAYLDKNVDKPEGFFHLAVSRNFCALYVSGERRNDERRVTFTRYPAVTEFIKRFDAGQYPFLRK